MTKGTFGVKEQFLKIIRQINWKKYMRGPLPFVLIAILLTVLVKFDLLSSLDFAASDALYQSPQAFDGNIVLVEIDDASLEEFGKFEDWSRDIIASAVQYLNQSEDCRPAAIALDVLFTGKSTPEADAHLVEAAKEYGNVISGCVSIFEDDFVWGEDGNIHWERFVNKGFSAPYPALRDVVTIGHINTMLGTDGILRHHMLRYTLPSGEEIPSMALAAAQKFQEYHGLPPLELPPTDSHGFWYVPFCGKPKDLSESISFAALLAGEYPADYFAGKIVMIGPYAPGLQDEYFTSIDHAQKMYGVEYQANAIQTLLWGGDYKKEAREDVQLAALFILLLAALFAFWKRPVKVSTAVWLLLTGGWLGACKLLYAYGYVLHALWIPVGVTVLYAGSLAANYISAALARRKITNTFERYVAPEIVGELLKEGDSLKLGGAEVDIAVLFVDVRGFTPMSEILEPAQVVEILNRFLTLISDCILDNKGTLDKFVGDCAMAFWNAPLPQEDYVMKAVQTAMDMVNGSQALSQELLEKYGRTVAFGIGVHVGPAVVGNIGSPRRMDYTAIGDTVNTAARLEANAPGGTIYISRAVVDELNKDKQRIRATSLGDTIKLKGKKEGFVVLKLEEIL